MGMGMGGAITAVAATITVGTAATTMAGGIIAIGGDFHLGSIAEELERLRYVNQRDAKFSNFRRRQCNPLC